jgi:hypothetical protein
MSEDEQTTDYEAQRRKRDYLTDQFVAVIRDPIFGPSTSLEHVRTRPEYHEFVTAINDCSIRELVNTVSLVTVVQEMIGEDLRHARSPERKEYLQKQLNLATDLQTELEKMFRTNCVCERK